MLDFGAASGYHDHEEATWTSGASSSGTHGIIEYLSEET